LGRHVPGEALLVDLLKVLLAADASFEMKQKV
jgi:hypothetical protein